MDKFKKELEVLINQNGLDNECNTPDYILAEYLTSCLETYRDTIRSRDTWFDKTGYEQGKTDALKVIEDIKAEIPILSHWQTDDGQDLLMVADALECIDKHTGKERVNDRNAPSYY